MAKSAILSVRIVADSKAARREIKSTEELFNRFEKRLNQASWAASAVGVAIGKLAYDAVSAASRLEQSAGGVRSVFKEKTEQIAKFAKTAWDSVGLSQNETNEMSARLGAQLKNMGVPVQELANKTLDLVKLGSDLAATFGGTTSDAVTALSALLRGERDPIERYGVSIKQADVNARKAQLGLSSLTGEAARNAELQATLSLLTEQTADALGQYARESGSAAQAQQELKARWENTSAELGQVLLPYMVELAEKLSELVGWISENRELVQAWGKNIAIAAAVIVSMNGAIKGTRFAIGLYRDIGAAAKFTASHARTLANGFKDGYRSAAAAKSVFSGFGGTLGGLAAKITRSTIVVKAMTAAQRAWNFAIISNPIILVITLIIAAIALLILNWDKVKAAAEKFFNFVRDAATWVLNALKPLDTWLTDVFGVKWEIVRDLVGYVIQTIIGYLSRLWYSILVPLGDFLAAVFTGKWEVAGAAARRVWQGIKDTITYVYDHTLRPVVDWVSSVFANVWHNVSAGAQAAFGRISGAIQNVIGWIRSAWEWFKRLGNAQPRIAGGGFKFSHALAGSGVPLTAAPGFFESRFIGSETTQAKEHNLNITINLPNYLGDKKEIAEILQREIRKLKQRKDGLIYA